MTNLRFPRAVRTIAAVLIGAFTLLACNRLEPTQTPASSGQFRTLAATTTFRNPIREAAPDPWLIYAGGQYRLLIGGDTIRMVSAPSLDGLRDAKEVQVWADSTASRCCELWAPELHAWNGKWYILYTATSQGVDDNHRQHVLESANGDPAGPYSYKGQWNTGGWAIDGTMATINGSLYALWSARVSGGQGIAIAPMSNPWTLNTTGTVISTPTFDWEKSGANVNEGPEILVRNGKVSLVYSASTCFSANYALGLLTASASSNLTAPSSWTKRSTPVFSSDAATGTFAPGHNGFFKSPDGTQDWIVYHAQDSNVGGCPPTRPSRAQRFTWNGDDTPNFGTPTPLTTDLALPSGDPGYKVSVDDATPAVVSTGSGNVTVFVRGADNALWTKSANNGAWGGWQSLGGSLRSAPAAVAWGSGYISVFARGTTHELFHRMLFNGTWQNWENLGGGLSSGPGATYDGSRIHVFIRGAAFALYRKQFISGVGWQNWELLDGSLRSAPVAASWGTGYLSVFSRTFYTDQLLQRFNNGSSWFAWDATSLGGSVTTVPGVVARTSNVLDVFARGSSDDLQQRTFTNGSGWGGWSSLGGVLTSGPGVAVRNGGTLEVVVRGSTDEYFSRTFSGGNWSGWTNIGKP
jgi:GH43 family beta-xylosidase